MTELCPRDRKVYEYIKMTLSERGYSPSVRDIQAALSIKSTSTVQASIKRIEEMGLVSKVDGKSRTLRIEDIADVERDRIPLLGDVRSGAPLDFEDNFDGYVYFRTPSGTDRGSLFAFRAVTDQRDRGILCGDIVIVERGAAVQAGDRVAAPRGGGLAVGTLCDGCELVRFSSDVTCRADAVGKVVAAVRYY